MDTTKTAAAKRRRPLREWRNLPIESYRMSTDEPAAYVHLYRPGTFRMEAVISHRVKGERPSIVMSGWIVEPETMHEDAGWSYHDTYDAKSQEMYDVGNALLDLDGGAMRLDTFAIHWRKLEEGEEDQAVAYRHVHLNSIEVLPDFACAEELDQVLCRIIARLAEDDLFTVDPRAFSFDLGEGISQEDRNDNVVQLMKDLGFVLHRGYWVLAHKDQQAASQRLLRTSGSTDSIDLMQRGSF